MATAFALNREEICKRALRKCGAVGAGEDPAPEDSELALESLDLLIKELPVEGFGWLKLTPDATSLTLETDQVTALPTDYGGEAKLYRVDSAGNEIPLVFIPWHEYLALEDKDESGDYPTHYSIRNDSAIFCWPDISSTVSAKLYYRKITSDTEAGANPDAPRELARALVYLVAADIGDEMGAAGNAILRWLEIGTTLREKVCSYTETKDNRPLRLGVKTRHGRTRVWGE
jgi:hypothetical protein